MDIQHHNHQMQMCLSWCKLYNSRGERREKNRSQGTKEPKALHHRSVGTGGTPNGHTGSPLSPLSPLSPFRSLTPPIRIHSGDTHEPCRRAAKLRGPEGVRAIRTRKIAKWAYNYNNWGLW